MCSLFAANTIICFLSYWLSPIITERTVAENTYRAIHITSFGLYQLIATPTPAETATISAILDMTVVMKWRKLTLSCCRT